MQWIGKHGMNGESNSQRAPLLSTGDATAKQGMGNLVDPWTNIEYLLECLSRIHLIKVVAAVRARKTESLFSPHDASQLLQVLLIVDRNRDTYLR
jgi:hypothetical protein